MFCFLLSFSFLSLTLSLSLVFPRALSLSLFLPCSPGPVLSLSLSYSRGSHTHTLVRRLHTIQCVSNEDQICRTKKTLASGSHIGSSRTLHGQASARWPVKAEWISWSPSPKGAWEAQKDRGCKRKRHPQREQWSTERVVYMVLSHSAILCGVVNLQGSCNFTEESSSRHAHYSHMFQDGGWSDDGRPACGSRFLLLRVWRQPCPRVSSGFGAKKEGNLNIDGIIKVCCTFFENLHVHSRTINRGRWPSGPRGL